MKMKFSSLSLSSSSSSSSSSLSSSSFIPLIGIVALVLLLITDPVADQCGLLRGVTAFLVPSSPTSAALTTIGSYSTGVATKSRSTGYTSSPYTATSSTTSSSRLLMGGYGVEPNDKGCDFAQTHMIYGTRCLEKKITVNGKVITILQPTTTSSSTSTSTTSSGTDDDDDDDANNDNDNDSHGINENDIDLVIDDDESITDAFISYLVEQDQYDPLTGKTIIEIGSSVVSLVAALACGTTNNNENEGNGMGNGVPASVTACHFDENRLRILQHSYQFMNTNKSKDNNCCPLTTKALNLQEIYTDIETCQTITTNNNKSSASTSSSSSSSSSFSSLIPDADIILVTLSPPPPPPSSYLSSSTFTKEYQYHYILKYLQQTKARIVIYHKNPFAEQLINTSKFYLDTGDNHKSLLYDFPPTYE